MSTLRNRLDEYLAIRRALGFKLERAGYLLPDFVTYLEDHQARTITTELAVAWARQPAHAHPDWWAQRLSLVRGLAKYLQALDPATEVPPVECLPHCSRRATPYLYSDLNIIHLMEAARELRSPLRAETYATLLGLLAVTGMRIGEAIGLDRKDVDFPHRVATLRNCKFGKMREICLHDSTVEALAAYARFRDQLCPRRRGPGFFLSTTGTRLIYTNVQQTFRSLVRRGGIQPRSARHRPRLHDLRHTFAIRTLLRWYRAGADVERQLPLLSTYLGHSCPSSTYWYLSAAPELLAQAGERLERFQGELS